MLAIAQSLKQIIQFANWRVDKKRMYDKKGEKNHANLFAGCTNKWLRLSDVTDFLIVWNIFFKETHTHNLAQLVFDLI